MKKKHGSLSDLEKMGAEVLAENSKVFPKKSSTTKMAFNTSPLLNLLWPGYMWIAFFLCAYLLTAFFFYPYLWYFINGGPVPNLSGSRLKTFDPTKTGWKMMYPFIIVNFFLLLYGICFLIAKSKTTAILRKEVNWIKSHPFKILNFYQVIGGPSATKFKVTIYYTAKMPDEQRVKNILTGFQSEEKHSRWDGISYYHRSGYKNCEEVTFIFRGSGTRGSYLFYKNFHSMVDSVYSQLHNEHEIDRLEVN
jgi:hypothetical protein